MKKKQRAEALEFLNQPQAAAIIGSEKQNPAVFQEVYTLQEPYVYTAIVIEKEPQKIRYEVIEPGPPTTRREASS